MHSTREPRESSEVRIGVVGIPDGWSTIALLDAVERRTGFRHLIDMRDVEVDFAGGRALSRGQDICELDAIIVKKIAKTYTPSAIDRLELLSYVESRGPRLFSKPERMIPLIDRVSGTVKLQRGGIPMPPTVVTEDIAQAIAVIERYGACVLKPLFSTKARGMEVLHRPEDDAQRAALVSTLERYKQTFGPVLYLQQLLELPGRDLGVVFLGGEYLATYARVKQADSWTSSTAAGGRYQAYDPPEEIIALARRAQSLFELDFTCVDVVETEDGPKVFEVSAFGGFRGLKVACGIDAAARYVDYVLNQLAAGTSDGSRTEAQRGARRPRAGQEGVQAHA